MYPVLAAHIRPVVPLSRRLTGWKGAFVPRYAATIAPTVGSRRSLRPCVAIPAGLLMTMMSSSSQTTSSAGPAGANAPGLASPTSTDSTSPACRTSMLRAGAPFTRTEFSLCFNRVTSPAERPSAPCSTARTRLPSASGGTVYSIVRLTFRPAPPRMRPWCARRSRPCARALSPDERPGMRRWRLWRPSRPCPRGSRRRRC